ncbi:ABC transporter ATP-binding protein [Salipaludibacillus sp. LMS25]|jgi:ABC-2 type transport system ATP-binding protein|uniref:ABC transporter ATP-binding protein n=1 Tax=Salipaludibacillus sp. LMS25 TaxID=2924031 RepID=UPI0020CFEE9F|nr:ABC transporter ATP-binding protein [Salipaludibacillus sp. LMS25]UTR15367.1 ABC transporter ATP-binding protein [Salipaludibacillus sp. LMS25]
METIYDVKNVTKSYKKGSVTANSHITMSVHKGEILGLLGPNGAGKSTLIKQMVAHTNSTEGVITYKGINVNNQAKKVSREVAYYSQEPASLTSLKVKEAIYFCGRLRGLTRKSADMETAKLIAKLGLEAVKDKMLQRISGGQKRLAGIGTTLIGASHVLILDEPTNELDPKKRRLVWDIIQEKNREGVTVILVTHNILEAEQVVDRVAVINHGKLLALDNVSSLKERVDQRLRVDITFKSNGDTRILMDDLSPFGTLIPRTEQQTRIMIEKNKLSSIIELIQSRENIHSYAITPPTLEDVYFHIDNDLKKGEPSYA